MKTAFVLLYIFTIVTSLNVTEIDSEFNPQQLFRHDYAVFSFYKKSDKQSMKVDALMEEIQELVENAISTGEWR